MRRVPVCPTDSGGKKYSIMPGMTDLHASARSGIVIGGQRSSSVLPHSLSRLQPKKVLGLFRFFYPTFDGHTGPFFVLMMFFSPTVTGASGTGEPLNKEVASVL